MIAPESSWYKQGLRFSCQRCGYCCTFPGGVVWLKIEEIQALAAHMGMDLQAFGQKYLRQIKGRYSLIEKANGECVMYDKGKCSVYAQRPTQCRTFPFWPENCERPDTWEAVAKTCRGVNEGEHHSATEIAAIVKQQKDYEKFF